MTMKTPIYDFVKAYAERDASRFHMPGHKGKGPLGIESLDITEISGADTLYSANGIIEESENNASSIFGTAHTFYSTEGASLVIKAMLALAVSGKKNAKILAARGAHKAFVHAAAILDIDVVWLFPENSEHICDARVSAEAVGAALHSNPEVLAVYITSPDYLGNISDVKGIAEECKKRGIQTMKKLKITVLGKSYEVLVEDMGDVTPEQTVFAEHAATPPSVPIPPVERNTAVTVSAPMSGTVIEITAAVGDEVQAGSPLLKLEAMKMQNIIPAPKDGTVREILVQKGDTVSTGAPMFIMD